MRRLRILTEKNYIVYMHYFPNKKRYIGITRRGAKKRWGKNGNGYKGQVVYNAIKKYGWNNILHLIPYRNLTEEEAKAKEIELIAKYKTNDIKYGYNITAGGDDGSHRCTKVICIETHTIYNSILEASEEYNTDPTNITLACKGKQLTAVNRHWQYYEDYLENPMNEQTLKKRRRIAVKCLETNTIYDSMEEAGRKNKTTASNIRSVCKGERKTAGGYHWEYASQ